VCTHEQRERHPPLAGINHCHMVVYILAARRWKTEGIAIRAYDLIATYRDTVPAQTATQLDNNSAKFSFSMNED
jgi:hypothetical protein